MIQKRISFLRKRLHSGKNGNFPDMKKILPQMGIEPGTFGLRDLLT